MAYVLIIVIFAHGSEVEMQEFHDLPACQAAMEWVAKRASPESVTCMPK